MQETMSIIVVCDDGEELEIIITTPYEIKETARQPGGAKIYGTPTAMTTDGKLARETGRGTGVWMIYESSYATENFKNARGPEQH